MVAIIESVEAEPNTENVLFMDEYRRAKWLAELKRSRDLGTVAVFGNQYDQPAQIIQFPVSGEVPDGAA